VSKQLADLSVNPRGYCPDHSTGELPGRARGERRRRDRGPRSSSSSVTAVAPGPSRWTIADAAGNEADIATTMGRD